MSIKKNKRGIEAGGFNSIVLALIILFLSAGILMFFLKTSISKADEQLQVDFCRISNEIKLGVEGKTSNFATTPRLCNTIDKTQKKTLIPSGNYPQTREGAYEEIRDMIKDCWYMWLDGTVPNTFTKLARQQDSCFVCYMYGIKDEDKYGGINFEAIAESMTKPYFVVDRSDKCGLNGGFLVPCSDEDYCPDEIKDRKKEEGCPDDWERTTSKKAASSNSICCAKSKNECENKGGKCLTSSDSVYNTDFVKWSCPRDKTCFVRKDDSYSYIRYITQFESEGQIFFVSPQDVIPNNIQYTPDKNYAISFGSPSKQCPGGICYWLGGFGVFPAWSPPDTTFAKVLSEINFFGNALAIKYTEMSTPGLEYVPNYIMVSTLEQATKEFRGDFKDKSDNGLGCIVN